jgi:hypothetical protein
MCTPWASDSVVPAADWVGLGMFSGDRRIFKGRRPVRVPPRARVFPVQGLLASECAHFVQLGAPPGAFFIGGRCCGLLPPCLVLVFECLLFGT